MVDISLEYQGDLHCRAVHGPSSAVLTTDAPVDNQGRGESFSPTDLVATGLGTCMATVMAIFARKHGYAFEGCRVHVKKTMTRAGPRRIAELAVDVFFPASAWLESAKERALVEQEAHQCPVRLSLLPAIEVPVRFVWEPALAPP